MGERVDFMGVLVDKLSKREAEERLALLASSREPHQVVTVNLDFIRQALRNPLFRDLINTSSLALADGMPLVWASKIAGQPLPERVTGMDLLHMSCRLAERNGDGIFLLGAAPGVAAQTGAILQRQYPRLRLAGTYAPPFRAFSAQENDRMLEMIVSARPKYLFVAFGCPKQDFWIRDNLARLGAVVSFGVGGIFDYLTGRTRRAPSWAQNLGFEWLFRLMQEPSRLSRRYLVDDVPVLLKLIGYRLHPSRTPRSDLSGLAGTHRS